MYIINIIKALLLNPPDNKNTITCVIEQFIVTAFVMAISSARKLLVFRKSQRTSCIFLKPFRKFRMPPRTLSTECWE